MCAGAVVLFLLQPNDVKPSWGVEEEMKRTAASKNESKKRTKIIKFDCFD